MALAAIWIALGTNLVGLKIGKWTNRWAPRGLGFGVVLASRPPWSGACAGRRRSRCGSHVGLADPSIFWATFAYAMTGLELASLMAPRFAIPSEPLPRAGWIASAIAAVFYAAATVFLLVLLPPERISEMNGLAEAGGSAGRAAGGLVAPA